MIYNLLALFFFTFLIPEALVLGQKDSSKVFNDQSVVSYSGDKFRCQKENGKLVCEKDSNQGLFLTSKNTIVLRSQITAMSASLFAQSFLELENKEDVDTIYVFIRSPGGSIFAGDAITNVIRSSNKKVVVVIDFAASMAFHIAMHGSYRVALPTATLMQHHAAGTLGPSEFPNIENTWNWLKNKVNQMNEFEIQACSNTTQEQYMKNIDRDWWMIPAEALAAGCIDEIVTSVSCSKEFLDSRTIEYINFMGLQIKLEWSGCPLELYPRNVSISSLFGNQLTALDHQKIQEFLLLTTNPSQFYQQNGTLNLKSK